MTRALLTAALIFFVNIANAATNIDPRKAKYDVCGRFEIFHINGIMTDRPGAVANREQIKVAYGNSYKEHLIVYGLGYNQTRGFTTDLYQSALQVISGYAGATWDKFMNAVTFGVYSVGMPDATAKAIAKVITDKFAFTKPSPYQDSDLADIMNDFAQQSVFGARLVIVPHSQGNLYANLVYDKLIATGKPAQSIGVVGMAVPYSSVRTGNTFVTSWNDVVIDATRLPTLNSILMPNVNIPYQPSIDKLGHNLRATYLAHTVAGGARDMMVSRITTEFDGLRTVAASPVWAPPDGYGNLVHYGSVHYNPPCCGGAVPSYYWYSLPEPAGGYTGGSSGYIYGTLAQATTTALSIAKTCYNYHIAEVKRKQALGDYSWTQIQGGCWGPLSTPWAGSWWAYSGDYAPVFRQYPIFTTGSIQVTAGATCKR